MQKGWYTCKSQGIFLQHKDEVSLPISSVRNLLLWIYTVTYILRRSAKMKREQIILFSSTNRFFFFNWNKWPCWITQQLSIAKITSLIKKWQGNWCVLRPYPCSLQQQELVCEVLAVVQVDPWVCAAVKTGEEHDSDKHWPCTTEMRL